MDLKTSRILIKIDEFQKFQESARLFSYYAKMKQMEACNMRKRKKYIETLKDVCCEIKQFYNKWPEI